VLLSPLFAAAVGYALIFTFYFLLERPFMGRVCPAHVTDEAGALGPAFEGNPPTLTPLLTTIVMATIRGSARTGRSGHLAHGPSKAAQRDREEHGADRGEREELRPDHR